VVDQVKAKYDVEVTWLPYFLRPDTPPEGRPLPEYVHDLRRKSGGVLETRAAELGLSFVYGDWEYSSRPALEASEYAREQGQHDAFHSTVFRKYFGEGLALSDWAVLQSAAEEVGLDPAAMKAETETGKYKDLVEGHYFSAQSMGINGIPTYIVGNRFAVVGAQPLEVFDLAMEKLQELEA
jgi:predicted DsbA family dithiol-disulfide isomerase